MVLAAVRERPVPDGQAHRPSARDPRPPALNPPLTEAALSRLWAGQRFPAAALVTGDGVPLRVLHPGLRGRGAGPDFRDAIIATPQCVLRGDVELHVRATDFRAHGHHRDRRYDGLVLHVVFDDDAGEETALASGLRVPVVALASWVERRARELSSWLASPTLWREPCHDAIARLGEDGVRQALALLGDRRFAEREGAFTIALAAGDAGAALYRALLSGLGYGGDRTAFEQLAQALSWQELSVALAKAPEQERPRLAEALLLGAAGLLDAARHPYEADLAARWQRHNASRAAPGPLTASFSSSSSRPANHPARRLAGLAALLARHQPLFSGAPMRPEELAPAAELITSWTVPASGYWSEHIVPCVPARRPPGALIGRGRAIELLMNAVLPWTAALAEQRNEPNLAAAARRVLATLPSPGHYGRLTFLEANLRAGDRPLHLDARAQQGLLALYKTECTQGGCGRCVFS